MRIYIRFLVGILTTISFSHAAIYLDNLANLNMSTSQIKSATGATSSIPTSQPVILDQIKITTGTVSVVLSGSTSGTTIIEDMSEEAEQTNPINQLPDLQRDAEFLMSLRWLYDQGITKFQDAEKFMPENYLTRIDAAKMLSVLSRTVFGNNKIIGDPCTYTDIKAYDDITK